MNRNETFYRLLSQASGSYYLRAREERYQRIKELFNKLKKQQLDEESRRFLQSAEGIMADFEELLPLHMNTPIHLRNDLAEKCLKGRAVIFEYVAARTANIRYGELSNDEFVEMVHSVLTSHLLVALYLEECRGRLLEYLLFHKRTI